jgi:uncharacterized DUF497 family protein
MMWFTFLWFEWAIQNVEKHGLDTREVEFVVNNAKKPFPRNRGNDVFYVAGPTRAGRWIEVLYDMDGDVVVIFHARELTSEEAKRVQRMIRKG